MYVFIYDKTFEGLLTLVFESFLQKKQPSIIIGEQTPLPLIYDEIIFITPDEEKASRVWKGLNKKLSKEACRMLTITFLSELPDIELIIFHYIRKAFESELSIETNFADEHTLELSKIYRKVSREAERMRMFIRFQKAADDLFFAPIEPLYNVIPLIIEHFKDRFADQKWVIYDLRRKYGIYYNLDKVQEIRFEDPQFNLENGSLDEELMAEDEKKFQALWKNYFNSMTIKERINPKLHVQMLPKRFWKYLPEKRS